jgi:hypothetical protein
MACEEYRKLGIEHRFAVRRLWRYLTPRIDPILSMGEGAPSKEQIERAWAEEREVRTLLETHLETCEHCNRNEAQIAV